MKYSIALITESGTAYLQHRGRTSWTLRTARKHARDILTGKSGIPADSIKNIRLEAS